VVRREVTDAVRILLVRLREIGDVVFTTPAIRALRRRHPDAYLAYLVEPAAAPIVRHNPHLDDVIVAPAPRRGARFAGDLALARRLRHSRFDLAIDFHGGPRASLLTWLSGAPVRIGYRVAGRTWMYTRVVDRPRRLRSRHSVENQWDLLAAIGIRRPDPTRDSVQMLVEPGAAARVADRLAAAGLEAGDQLIVVHVSAGNPFRRWPADSFVQLTAALARDPSRRIVITSGPLERSAAVRIQDAARSRLEPDERPRIVAIDLTLDELRATMDRAALYIGGDSGPLHIAATSAVPIVGLYGPTLPARSQPWRDERFVAEAVQVDRLPCRPCDQRECAPGDFRCLTTITPSQVIMAAERALQRTASGGA